MERGRGRNRALRIARDLVGPIESLGVRIVGRGGGLLFYISLSPGRNHVRHIGRVVRMRQQDDDEIGVGRRLRALKWPLGLAGFSVEGDERIPGERGHQGTHFGVITWTDITNLFA